MCLLKLLVPSILFQIKLTTRTRLIYKLYFLWAPPGPSSSHGTGRGTLVLGLKHVAVLFIAVLIDFEKRLLSDSLMYANLVNFVFV